MARIKRKKILVNDENSINDLIQEIYNDAHQIRSSIVALFNKWNGMAKEEGQIAAFGKEVVSLINSLARNQDQKIAMVKILSDILYKKNTGTSDDSKKKNTGDDENDLSETAKADLRKMIEEARQRGEIDV